MPVPGRSFGRIDHVAILSQSISTISHLEFMPYTGKVLLIDHNSLSATDDRIVRLTHQTVRSRSVIGKSGWRERSCRRARSTACLVLCRFEEYCYQALSRQDPSIDKNIVRSDWAKLVVTWTFDAARD